MKDLGDTQLRDPPPIERALIRTGIGALDEALGGGIPRGDGLCLYFVPPTDDWSFLIMTMRAAQEDGNSVFWLGPWEPDVPRWKHYGVDPAKVMVATCNDPVDLKVKAQIVHECGADLLIVEGVSTIMNIESSGDTFRVWKAQQNAIYNMTHRERLSNTAIIFSRALGEKYTNYPVQYASDDDISVFIDDHRPHSFKAHVLSRHSHLTSREISCKLPLPTRY